jgi:hypothetical protein
MSESYLFCPLLSIAGAVGGFIDWASGLTCFNIDCVLGFLVETSAELLILFLDGRLFAADTYGNIEASPVLSFSRYLSKFC